MADAESSEELLFGFEVMIIASSCFFFLLGRIRGEDGSVDRVKGKQM